MAEDVVASLERYRRIGGSASLLATVDTATAPKRDEVTIRLEEVQATFIDNLFAPARADRNLSSGGGGKAWESDRLHRHRSVPLRRISLR